MTADRRKNRSIIVKGTIVTVARRNKHDYISLSDMVRNFDGQGALIEQWLKAKDTVLFLGVWEQLNNPEFNSLEFDGIRREAGRNSFSIPSCAPRGVPCPSRATRRLFQQRHARVRALPLSHLRREGHSSVAAFDPTHSEVLADQLATAMGQSAVPNRKESK